MSAFEEAFAITTLVSSRSAVSALCGEGIARAGVYDHGLLTILDQSTGEGVLESWAWLLNDNPVALATTWQGDVIFWSQSKGACFLFEAQLARSIFIDESISTALDVIFTQTGFKERVLLKEKCLSVVQRLGSLEYGQCFIPTPWPLLGGSGVEDTFELGSVDVYLSLVSQTIRQLLEQRGASV